MTPTEPQAANALTREQCLKRLEDVVLEERAVRNNPSRTEEREQLKAEHAAIEARLRSLKETAHRENTQRTFAGFGTPLHEAMVEALDPGMVAALEADALARLAEREHKASERRAAKTERPPKPEAQIPTPKASISAPTTGGPMRGPRTVEVIQRRTRTP